MPSCARVAAALAATLLALACDPGTPEAGGPASPSPPPETGGRGACVQAAPGYREPPADRPRYRLRIDVDPGARTVLGVEDVTFTPDLATDRLVFRLWPNGPYQRDSGASLEVGSVRIGDRTLTARLTDPTTLVVRTPEPLRPGDSLRVKLSWTLSLPGPVLDRLSVHGTSVRLGSFFPILAWEPGIGWATTPPTTTLAEASLAPTADFEVDVNVPAGLDVIATGANTGGTHWRATAVRDFAVAVGAFEVATATVQAPDPVRVTVGVTTDLEASPERFLDEAAGALEAEAARFGPYPWDTFSLAIMPDLGSAGIEYPTMVFQGEDSLDFATSHEVGHMWFYSLVGNDQGVDPWLDETLASWAQAVDDRVLPFFRDAPMPPIAAGNLGRPMTFWDRHEEEYFESVYLQGVQMLDSFKDPRGVDCALRLYTARRAWGIAQPDDLEQAFVEVFGSRARATFERFGALD